METDVGEVAGACFCCKFDDLVATAQQLGEHQQPDVLIAEPVGSCTDLAATVIEPLRQGHWRGPVNMTEVDFYVDRVSPTTVSIHVSGTVLHQANRSYASSDAQNYFYDRPRTCKRIAAGRAFDCTRYTDMHIDNGLLCGVYEAPDQVYRLCLDPAQ